MTVFALADAHSSGTIRDQPRRWRGMVDRLHALASAAMLGAAALVFFVWPSAHAGTAAWSGAALLVGGALIGVPHGSSDFVVAYRVLKPTLGMAWLPIFLIAYLLVVASVMLAWIVAPLVTLLLFVALSCLHFGYGDLSTEERRSGLALLVRATTPLLPVLLIQPTSLTGLIAMLGGLHAATVGWALDSLRWLLLLPWALAVSCYVASRLAMRTSGKVGVRASYDALEVSAIALAAVTLPPLLAFAIYFCVVHAVRHMIDIADQHQPRDGRRAARLVLAIIVPSALVCLVVLGLTWDGIVGSLDTMNMLVWSLRLIAALTVPHMALEAWAERVECRS